MLRRDLLSATFAAVIMAVSGPALSQGYPTRPITLLVPYAPGGRPTSSVASSPRNSPTASASVSSSRTGQGRPQRGRGLGREGHAGRLHPADGRAHQPLHQYGAAGQARFD